MASFKNVKDLIPKYNKYRIALLKSYYSITRNATIPETNKKFQNEDFIDEINREILLFLSGQDIALEEKADSFKAPDSFDLNVNKLMTAIDNAKKVR